MIASPFRAVPRDLHYQRGNKKVTSSMQDGFNVSYDALDTIVAQDGPSALEVAGVPKFKSDLIRSPYVIVWLNVLVFPIRIEVMKCVSNYWFGSGVLTHTLYSKLHLLDV